MINKEKLIESVKNSESYASVCRYLGMSHKGGNNNTIKKYIKLYEINIDHFTGRGWNTGDKFKSFCKKFELVDILNGECPTYTTSHLRDRLIKSGLKENRCEECGLTEWNNMPLSLHLHHIDGDNKNNKLDNLKILCPNCHTQTDTYCSKNRKNNKTYTKIELLSAIAESKNYAEVKRKLGLNKNGDNNMIKKILFDNNLNFNAKNDIENLILSEIKLQKISILEPLKNHCSCGKKITHKAKNCPTCDKIRQRKVPNRPTKEELTLLVSSSSLEAVGRNFGVTGNAVKKWLK